MEEINPSDFAVYFDSNVDTNLEIAKRDFINYARKLWGVDALEIVEGKPVDEKPVIIWFSTGDEAKNLLND